jgi:putative ABC transport system permease protein
MQHWSRLATRNWQARKVRTFLSVFAVALGTAEVVWVACSHESVRRSIMGWAGGYVGGAHITVSSTWGKHDQIPQRLTRKLEQIENVALVAPRLMQRRACRAVTRETLANLPDTSLSWTEDDPEVDLSGIDLDGELLMRKYPLTAGRMLTNDDSYACVLEAKFAHQEEVGLGDYLLVWDPSSDRPYELEIVGLFERRSIGIIQKPLALTRLDRLQAITQKSALVSTIDVMLAETDRKQLRQTFSRILVTARRIASNARVRSAEARMKQVERAQDNQRMLLVMLGCVAMLTALIIILSTLGMGLQERIRQLGLLRCVGMTRFQLALLVLFEVIPLGVLGAGWRSRR